LKSLYVYRGIYDYATWTGDRQQTYGSARECRAHEDCRLATFNINLTGTGFVVHPQASFSISKLYQHLIAV